MKPTLILLLHLHLPLLLLLLPLQSAEAFAAAKTKSRPKKAQSASGGGGGGFGAPTQAPPSYTPDTSATTQSLLQFLKHQKARGLEQVEIGHDHDNGVRGLFAAQNFQQGQLLCQIPSDCALALSDPNLPVDDAPTLSHGGANFWNMYWNNPQARTLWAPYLDTLPTADSPQFDPTPDFFSPEQLQLLEFPRIIQQAQQRQQDILTVAAEQGLGPTELQFATWLTTSRVFAIAIATPEKEPDGNESKDNNDDDDHAKDEKQQQQPPTMTKTQTNTIRVMVPFIDMANHNSDQPNAKLTLIDPEKDEAWFALEATRPIKKGKEIVISYGSGVASTVELLLNYGFVPHRNKMDEFMLQKGGDDVIATLDGWTTTLQQDQARLAEETDATMRKILNFRIRLKGAYPPQSSTE